MIVKYTYYRKILNKNQVNISYGLKCDISVSGPMNSHITICRNFCQFTVMSCLGKAISLDVLEYPGQVKAFVCRRTLNKFRLPHRRCKHC